MRLLFFLAHAGEPPEPHDLWTAWTWQPGVVMPLVVFAILYAIGACRQRGLSRSQIALFAAGWLTLFIALISPVHALGEALFSAHMAQHELLMVVAAPLLVLARPLPTLLWAFPLKTRRQIGSAVNERHFAAAWALITAPLAAWLIHTIVLWGWHMPALFNATLTNNGIHSAQHICFLGSALLFWWGLLRTRMAYGAAIIYMFTTAIHTSILGALLTFAPSPWYAGYLHTTAAWGMTPLEDQQLGGLIMWVPAELAYVFAGLWLVAGALRESEFRVHSREGAA